MSDVSKLAQIKQYNLETAELAAAGKRELVVQLLEDAVTTVDPDLRRKIYETLGKDAISQEPKQQQVLVAPLNFQIVLDDTPQVAPPRRAKAIARNVEDAVLVLPQLDDPDDSVSLADYVD